MIGYREPVMTVRDLREKVMALDTAYDMMPVLSGTRRVLDVAIDMSRDGGLRFSLGSVFDDDE